MHLVPVARHNSKIGDIAPYYRFKESYRDVHNHVHSYILLNVGFEPEIEIERMRKIVEVLNYRFQHRNERSLFQTPMDDLTDFERSKAESYWRKMIKGGKIDRFEANVKKIRKEAERYADIDTVEHTDARELGAEWLCRQAIDELGIEDLLRRQGWSDAKIYTTIAHLITRTVYPGSERKCYQRMRDNSSAAELCGPEGWMPGFNALYEVPDMLLSIKDKLERHLCNRTDHLFNTENRIVLYDLTNFYFEGSKRSSEMAKYGRSKEKRYDAKLLVLALCINTEGFIRYSRILEGNTADPKSLPDMIDNLASTTHTRTDKTLVVIDAGIATEENLQRIKEKGYNYLCVSRKKLKDYELSPDKQSVKVLDADERVIMLHEVHTAPNDDYYLMVTSPSKALTENSIIRQMRDRFEMEMQRICQSVARKGGIKRFEKVVERVGRVKEKYPTVSGYYNIQYIKDKNDPDLMAEVKWNVIGSSRRKPGTYFLRSNVRDLDEKTVWDYYNLIRDIECTNRQLKTDLNLRPIYHQTDARCEAHIFFGLLSYWIVNTIRQKLKLAGETCYWSEIVRRMSTQKLVTTKAINANGDEVELRISSKPKEEVKAIYDKLNMKYAPKRRWKICSTQKPPD